MKHTKTVHENEEKAKLSYPDVKSDDPVLADESVEKSIRLLQKMKEEDDLRAVEESRLAAIGMEAMKDHSMLKSADGELLCSWTKGRSSSKTDWDALCRKYKVTVDDIASFTKTSVGARRFSVCVGE